MSFLKAYNHKEFSEKKCAVQKHSACNLDILRGYISIPGELLSSRARLRFLISNAKLNLKLYIYNRS